MIPKSVPGKLAALAWIAFVAILIVGFVNEKRPSPEELSAKEADRAAGSRELRQRFLSNATDAVVLMHASSRVDNPRAASPRLEIHMKDSFVKLSDAAKRIVLQEIWEAWSKAVGNRTSPISVFDEDGNQLGGGGESGVSSVYLN